MELHCVLQTIKLPQNLCPHCVHHWFMKIKPLVLTLKANTKSQMSLNCLLLHRCSCIVLKAACCLEVSDTEVVPGQVEGCNSHLLIVTGRGWTPARKEAIISLSSTARCYNCQNFNRATKSIFQGQIKKSRSKPLHTEKHVLLSDIILNVLGFCCIDSCDIFVLNWSELCVKLFAFICSDYQLHRSV